MHPMAVPIVGYDLHTPRIECPRSRRRTRNADTVIANGLGGLIHIFDIFLVLLGGDFRLLEFTKLPVSDSIVCICDKFNP